MRGHVWDAVVTAWDGRLRVPLLCGRLRQRISRKEPMEGFYVNTQPTCFTDPFAADRDAVYVTYAPEIRRHIAAYATLHETSAADSTEDIYLVATKR